MDDLLNISEAAKMLGLSPSTLRRLEKDGYIEGYGLRVIYTPGGQRRYALDEVQQLYKTDGFSGQLGLGEKPALLIRDFSIAFTMDYSQLVCQIENQVEVVSRLIDEARKYNIPIICSMTIYDPTVGASELWGRKFPNIQLLDPKSNWVQIHPDLREKSFDLVNKHVYISDFHDQKFRDFIRTNNIDTLILAGTSTSGSIRATAVDALQHNIRVVIPREAVADRSIAIQNFTLMDLNARYADVVSIDSVYTYFKELNNKRQNI